MASRTAMDPTTCVLGIGSPFGADRAGWVAIDRLETAGLPGRFPLVRFERLDRPGATLVAYLGRAERIVLIDALAGGTPGRVRELGPADLLRRRGTSSHGFGVAEALALAEVLGERPPQMWLFGIEVGEAEEAERFDYAPLVTAVTEVLCGHSLSRPTVEPRSF